MFVVKPSNFFFVDSKLPLLKNSKLFHMCLSLTPPPPSLSSSLLSLSGIFTYPFIWVGRIPPFQFMSFLPLLLEPSIINILFLPGFFPSFMFYSVLVCCCFFPVVSPHQTSIPIFLSLPPNLLSHLHFDAFWPSAIDHLCYPIIDFCYQHTAAAPFLKGIGLIRHSWVFPSPLQHCDTRFLICALDFSNTGTWFSYFNSYCSLK